VTADAYITCRVSQEVKTRVRDLAAREGATESGIIKQLLGTMLREPSGPVPTAVVPPVGGNRGSRLYVRIASAERRLLTERATARGVKPATYTAMLLRTHLRGVTPLPKAEYVAFRQAVLELSAIGRNLHQIARALREEGKSQVPGKSEVQAMVKIAGALRDHFKALLTANERAWKDGHA
jgi:predicted DNA binding CopG/RHH family protein